MAKPIDATPTLRGADAIRFIERMAQEEKAPAPRRIATLRRALNTKFRVYLDGDTRARPPGCQRCRANGITYEMKATYEEFGWTRLFLCRPCILTLRERVNRSLKLVKGDSCRRRANSLDESWGIPSTATSTLVRLGETPGGKTMAAQTAPVRVAMAARGRTKKVR